MHCKMNNYKKKDYTNECVLPTQHKHTNSNQICVLNMLSHLLNSQNSIQLKLSWFLFYNSISGILSFAYLLIVFVYAIVCVFCICDFSLSALKCLTLNPNKAKKLTLIFTWIVNLAVNGQFIPNFVSTTIHFQEKLHAQQTKQSLHFRLNGEKKHNNPDNLQKTSFNRRKL